MLLATTLACVGIGSSIAWFQSQLAQSKRERQIGQYGDYQFMRLPNIECEMDYVIPEYVLRLMGEETKDHFFRITELDITLDELFLYSASDLEYYSVLASVHTIRLKNSYVTLDFIDVLRSFEGLRTLDLTAAKDCDADGEFIYGGLICYGEVLDGEFVEITEEILPGITIIRNGG